MALDEHFEDQEHANYIARKLLSEILDQCQRKDIDAEGLIQEISEAGIHDSYIEKIRERDDETYHQLYIEKMAMTGRKRMQLQDGISEDMKDLPRKYVENRLNSPPES